MDDYREAQRQRWQQAAQDGTGAQPGGPSAASAPAVPSPSGASSSAAPSSSFAPAREVPGAAPNETVTVDGRPAARRLHILPVGRDPAVEARSGATPQRLELIAPVLKLKRDMKESIKSGVYIRAEGCEFVVVKIEPEDSVLVQETDYFVDGDPIQRLEKIQFICLWDFESSRAGRGDTSVLFSEYVSPYYKALSVPGEDRASIVNVGDVTRILDLDFQVLATQPQEDVGIVDSNTLVFVDWDTTPEFEKIHIVPFQDTLPHAYDFNIFHDYIKPYLRRNKHGRMKVNDQFTFQGVQFKVVCCEPEGPARVGASTAIHCEGVLHPTLRNMLPPELLEQLATLPPGLQMLLLNTEAFAGGYEERLIEVQDMLSRRRGLQDATLERIEKFRWGERASIEGSEMAQTQCMVCLCDFENGEEVRRLPCTHLYHAACIDEWLRRCTDCPICKANVDRAVRQY